MRREIEEKSESQKENSVRRTTARQIKELEGRLS